MRKSEMPPITTRDKKVMDLPPSFSLTLAEAAAEDAESCFSQILSLSPALLCRWKSQRKVRPSALLFTLLTLLYLYIAPSPSLFYVYNSFENDNIFGTF
jgi:hypothetical protein